jgi:hypothetical protein
MDTPVLVHTTVAREEVERRIAFGPNVVFLPKPSLPEDILAAADKLLARIV